MVEAPRARGGRLVTTTATNQALNALTVRHQQIAELPTTEVEVLDGRCTTQPVNLLNMREGKVVRHRV